MNMKIQFSRIITLTALIILLVVPVFVFTASYSHAEQNIVDGDLVTVSPNPDIYIVKIVGVKKFKRLILNPDIFNSYGHLKWSDVKTIDQATLDLYKLSELVIEINPDGSVADPKVYRVISSGNSDVGERSWLNLTASEFEAAGYDWDSLYHVNHKEALPSFYPTKTPLTYQDVLSIRATIAPAATIAPIITTPPTQNTETPSQRYLTTEGGAVYDTVLKKFISSTPSSQTATITQSSTIVVGSINLSANPSVIPADGKSTSVITATVRDVNNNVVSGQTVYFSYGNVTVAAVTDVNGNASVSYIATNSPGLIIVIANVEKISNTTQLTQFAPSQFSIRDIQVTGSDQDQGVILGGIGIISDAVQGQNEQVQIEKIKFTENSEVVAGDFYNYKLVNGNAPHPYPVFSSSELSGNTLLFDFSSNPIVLDYQKEIMFFIVAKLSNSANGKTSHVRVNYSSDVEVFSRLTHSFTKVNSNALFPVSGGYLHKFTQESDGYWWELNSNPSTGQSGFNKTIFSY